MPWTDWKEPFPALGGRSILVEDGFMSERATSHRIEVDPLFRRICSSLERAGIRCDPGDLHALAGDASSRRYVRVHPKDAHPSPSCVIMVLPRPGAFQSEERTNGPVPEEMPFISVHRHLSAISWPVPDIYHYDADEGILLLEDLGDVTLEAWWRGKTHADMRRWYEEAVDLIVALQTLDRAELDAKSSIALNRFDHAVLKWELEHFLEYGLPGFPAAFSRAERGVIRSFVEDMSQRLAGLTPVIVHRDFHSRNLMVHGGRLRVIDFQDALLGPRHYDLASLLFDAYVQLDGEMRAHVLEYYFSAAERAGVASDDPRFEDFRANFEQVALHRGLKMIGRFGYLAKERGKTAYLAYVPALVERMIALLDGNPEAAEFYQVVVNPLSSWTKDTWGQGA